MDIRKLITKTITTDELTPFFLDIVPIIEEFTNKTKIIIGYILIYKYKSYRNRRNIDCNFYRQQFIPGTYNILRNTKERRELESNIISLISKKTNNLNNIPISKDLSILLDKYNFYQHTLYIKLQYIENKYKIIRVNFTSPDLQNDKLGNCIYE